MCISNGVRTEGRSYWVGEEGDRARFDDRVRYGVGVGVISMSIVKGMLA